MRRRTGTGRTGVALAVAVLAAAAPAAADAARTEEPVRSAAPDAKLVEESFVREHAPLPDSVGAHPEACDWITYLRFRHRRGPREPKDADAVIVIIPGFLGGASSFDQLARNTVRNAAKRRRYVEFWALDRRANCLEDSTGVQAAADAHDPSVAYDYYWGGRAVNGKRFAGFAPEAGFLKEFGLDLTLRDWYRVIQRIPGQRRRARKVICGGHSFGGPLTAAFASWDFDGDPKTERDAGYEQCAGLVGLDTTLAVNNPLGGASPEGVLVQAAVNNGSPYVDVPPLTPETFEVPAVFGVGAAYEPQGTDLLRKLPHSTNIDLAARMLFSRDTVHFATGMPSIRDFTITNQVALGGVFDDNSEPLAFIRTSVGFFAGGPLWDKNFPSPDGTLALPKEPKTPLYSWRNYDQVGAGGAPVALNDSGAPYTSRKSEISDISQLARTLFEAPANFVEHYFPTRLVRDMDDAANGNRQGSLSNLRYDGPAKRPALMIQAADGFGADSEPPNRRPLSRKVVLPGYNHVDVLTAARRQNDGRPEPGSTALTDFVLQVVPPEIRLSIRPRRIRARDLVRLRFRTRSATSSCRRGVAIRLGDRRVRTGRRGRASLRLRLGRAGRRQVVARKRGCRSGSATLRVLQG
jgi:hypothetical protein